MCKKKKKDILFPGGLPSCGIFGEKHHPQRCSWAICREAASSTPLGVTSDHTGISVLHVVLLRPTRPPRKGEEEGHTSWHPSTP